jgi:tripartite motif-containing protein 33
MFFFSFPACIGLSVFSSQSGRDLYCKIHSEENLNYFCVECEHLICKHCNLTTHKTHTSKHVSEVATSLRKKLKANTESEEHKNYLMWLAERRETFSKEIDNCRRSEKHSIQDIIDRADEVIAILTEIKQIMIKKAGDITLRQYLIGGCISSFKY